MDVPTFLTTYPVFKNVAPSLVLTTLNKATLYVDPTVFRELTDTAIGLKCAAFLAIDPQGGDVRLVAKDGTTTYGKMFDDLRESMVVGVAVAGGPCPWPGMPWGG